MEYEIGDDPQGLPEHPDGERDGGLREDRIFFRKDAPTRRANQLDDAQDEDTALRQLDEVG